MENTDAFKSKQQIAKELQISYSTLYRKLKELDIDIPKNRLLAPCEYKVIYNLFRRGQGKGK